MIKFSYPKIEKIALKKKKSFGLKHPLAYFCKPKIND